MVRSAALVWLVVVSWVGCDISHAPAPTPGVKVPPQAVAPPADPAPPPAPAPRHPHATPRASIQMLGIAMPAFDRGVVVQMWGIAGDTSVTLDRDARVLTRTSRTMQDGRKQWSRTLTEADAERLYAAAIAAWHEQPRGPMATATDVSEDLYVFDGDEAFHVHGAPIDAAGRPAAAQAAAVMFAAAKQR